MSIDSKRCPLLNTGLLKSAFFMCMCCLAFTPDAMATGQERGCTFFLPVDWTENRKQDLAVIIPKSYVSLQPEAEWGKAPLIEFIPAGETDYGWSEIITMQTLVAQRISAVALTEKVLQDFARVVKIDTLYQEKTQTMALYICKYVHQGKQEMIGLKYLSGPVDCAGVQYTIRPKRGQSEQQVVAKIKRFFEQNCRLIEEK